MLRQQLQQRINAGRAFDDALQVSDGAAEDVWTALFGRLSPVGRHHALSRKAFELFLALKSDDVSQAEVHMSALREMAADRGFGETREAVEGLHAALRLSERCGATSVQRACSYAVRIMVRDGLISYVPYAPVTSSSSERESS